MNGEEKAQDPHGSLGGIGQDEVWTSWLQDPPTRRRKTPSYRRITQVWLRLLAYRERIPLRLSGAAAG